MNNSNDIAIRLTNVTKRYTIHHEKPSLDIFVNLYYPVHKCTE